VLQDLNEMKNMGLLKEEMEDLKEEKIVYMLVDYML
jgi:hypothetical protein